MRKERWDAILDHYTFLGRVIADGIEAVCNQDDEDMHAVIDNLKEEIESIERLLH